MYAKQGRLATNNCKSGACARECGFVSASVRARAGAIAKYLLRDLGHVIVHYSRVKKKSVTDQ